MNRILLLAAASGLMLAACGDKAADGGKSESAAANAPSEKRQPGSWSNKIEVVSLEGEGVTPGAKDEMNQMFAAMSGMSICVTPEAAAAEDRTKALSEFGSRGAACTMEKQRYSGKDVEFAATCKGEDGRTMKMAAKGTAGATAQDITMTMTSIKADGAREGEIVMRVSGERKGECGPNDITPPAPGAAAPAAKS